MGASSPALKTGPTPWPENQGKPKQSKLSYASALIYFADRICALRGDLTCSEAWPVANNNSHFLGLLKCWELYFG